MVMDSKKINPSLYHIMLVDESPGSLKSYHSILNDAGFQVSSSINPQTPIEGLQSGDFDLVLFSVSTLETYVFKAVKRFRDLAHQKNIPLIVLSSMDRHEIYDRYFVEGVDYIQKPIHATELIMRVGIWARYCAHIKQLTQKINTQDQLIQKETQEIERISDMVIESKTNKNSDTLTHLQALIQPNLNCLQQKNNSWNDRKKTIKKIKNVIDQHFSKSETAISQTLTRGEKRIVPLLKNGLSTKEIAERLSLSPSTIETYRKTIRKKLGLTKKSIRLTNYV